MKIVVAAVADHAWVENGCLSISRTFDTIRAPAFPFTVSRLSVGLRLLIRRSEAGRHALNVSMVDPDGKKMMNSDINIDFNPPEGALPESSFSFALNGQNFIFPQPGDYAIDIIIDGRVEASIPIYARQTPGAEKPDIPDRI